MKILVIGANGQLGLTFTKLLQNSQYQVDFAHKSMLNLAYEDHINSFLIDKKYDYMINCAAYTAVDNAEDEEDLANQINGHSVGLLAEWCAENNCTLIHFSTDYVFNGQQFQPYTELDNCSPQSVYGSSKLLGEQLIDKSNASAFVIRTSWVYSPFGNNFFKTMHRLGSLKDELNVVFDQIGTPTYTFDLANAVLSIIEKNLKTEGLTVYHYSNEGICSWYDFAFEIMKQSKLNCRVYPILSSQYPTKAKRPFYSVLNKNKIKSDLQISIPHWTESLQSCIHYIHE